MTKSFNFMEKLEEISKSLSANSAYNSRFMDKKVQKQSMRSLVMQNFDNYEEEKKADIEFGTPAQRLAYQRVSANHQSKRF